MKNVNYRNIDALFSIDAKHLTRRFIFGMVRTRKKDVINIAIKGHSGKCLAALISFSRGPQKRCLEHLI